MANQLKMAEIHSLLTLRTRGWSFRRIARELGVHRETVARYVQLAAAAVPPSGRKSLSLCALPTAGAAATAGTAHNAQGRCTSCGK